MYVLFVLCYIYNISLCGRQTSESVRMNITYVVYASFHIGGHELSGRGRSEVVRTAPFLGVPKDGCERADGSVEGTPVPSQLNF